MELYEDEARFVRALKARRPEAAEALLRGYGGLLKSVARRYAPGLDWEDIVGDAILSIWQNAERFDESGSFKAWAAAVARYRAIDAVRAARREQAAGQGAELEALGAAGPDEYFAAELDDLFKGLPPGDRQLLLSRYFYGYSPQQLAQGLALSEGAVNTRVSRAKKRLAARLQGGTSHEK